MGSLTVIFGPMFSGKTALLIDFIRNAKGFVHVISKCVRDNNRSEVVSLNIETRQGDSVNSLKYELLSEFYMSQAWGYETWKNIFIDEGQFFPDVTDFCDRMANRGANVYVTVLNRNFCGGMFPNVMQLLARADRIIQKVAHCDFCDPNREREANAPFTVRVAPLPQDGYVEKEKTHYKAACRQCYQRENRFLSE